MDELLIDEKKYVSSKRAAKMTGYAKDYVGQLCREGRVPARLVGRSWYVLETAIQDHRFGDTNVPPIEAAPAWESPRYEAAPSEVLPPVNRMKVEKEPEIPREQEQEKETEKVAEVPGNLQESWQAWFSNFDAHTKENVEPASPPDTGDTATPLEEQQEKPEVREEPRRIEAKEDDVPVPIRTIYQLPPEELLPHRSRVESATEEEEDQEDAEDDSASVEGPRQTLSFRTLRTIQISGVVLAVAMASMAVIGTGYFDKYLISVSTARIMAGVVLYEK